MSETPNNNKPVDTERFDRVHVAIFHNSREGDGEDGWHSVSLTRRYKDARGEWHSTSSFTDRDLPHLQRAIAWAEQQLRPSVS